MRRKNIIIGIAVIAMVGLLSGAIFSYFWFHPIDKGTQLVPPVIKSYGKGYRFNRNGWVYLHIEGQPYERGYQHGYLLAPELKEELRVAKYITYLDNGKDWNFFVKAAEKIFTNKINPEFLQEIRGIADGAKAAGVDVSWQDILFINGVEEVTDNWWSQAKENEASEDQQRKERCSAFIATGKVTKDGKIVLAHNTWEHFVDGQSENVIIDLQPASGHRILMQAGPGYIHSMSDFFVTDAGIVGAETSIADFHKYDVKKSPEFLRVRQAMQYADNLDDFVRIMLTNNNGGYANSWLLGDVNTGEIMRFELGYKYYDVKRTTDGYFIGFNSVYDPRIRNLECTTADTFTDIAQSTGARKVRFAQLMKKYFGKIDVTIAQQILADHYDVWLKKNQPTARTIDSHAYLDATSYPGARQPFQPKGTMDGKVVDSTAAQAMSFYARWGNSSGMPFNAEQFFVEHQQYDYLQGYLIDRPSQPWTLFQIKK